MSKLLHNDGQALLGKDALEAVKRHAEALELPPCPFCGGKAQVCLGVADSKPHVLIRCERCGGSTLTINAGYHEPEGDESVRFWGENVRSAITVAAARRSRRQ